MLAASGFLRRQRAQPAGTLAPAEKGYFQIDNSESSRDLGLEYRALDDTVIDTAKQFARMTE